MKEFVNLKRKVIKKHVLALPNFDKVFQVDCDASGMEIGAVLSQEGKPIVFFNENMNEAKKKYLVYEKELYAIIEKLKMWSHYLLPKEFVLYTDHQAMRYLNTQTKLNQRNMKWSKFM